MSSIRTIMMSAPVIPVLVIDEVMDARGIAEALVGGGLRVLEITMRTPQALDAMREMAKVDGAIVGAGTVLNETMLAQAKEAGAKFIVSPGLTTGIVEAAQDMDMPILPGIANASDIMRGLDLGLTHFKFFPAEAAGGLKALKALSGPFGQASFCPTGGITQDSASEWLAHDPVLCVGGSWLVPKGETNLAAVRLRAEKAAALRS